MAARAVPGKQGGASSRPRRGEQGEGPSFPLDDPKRHLVVGETVSSGTDPSGCGQPPGGGIEPGMTLAAALRRAGWATSWNEARRLCATGKIQVDGEVVLDPARRLWSGARVELFPSAPRPDRQSARLPILYEDTAVLVVDKPADLSTVPFEPGERDTLVGLLRDELRRRQRAAEKRERQGAAARGAPRGAPAVLVVHRLDRDTSGVLVFARSAAAQRGLQAQFRRHSVERRYLALVAGRLERGLRIDAPLVRDRGDGRRGVGEGPGAREAVTFVEPLEALADATLVECRLLTGRTHQVRIHLAHVGHPLLGDDVYAPREQAPPPRLLGEAGRALLARHMLHARVLGFEHPISGRPLRFESPPPEDFAAVLEKLRERR